jgi:hypothetical protein
VSVPKLHQPCIHLDGRSSDGWADPIRESATMPQAPALGDAAAYPSDLMRMWPVDQCVNKPESDDVSLLDEVDPFPHR